MDREEMDQRISRISTMWTALGLIHTGRAEEARAAQERLLRRYSPAVYRYLLGATRDPDRADELFQEFALRLARGGFRNADPGRGRFRDFLKVTLSRLVINQQQRRRPTAPLPEPGPAAGPGPPALEEADRAFVTAWREELMAAAWEALAEWERRTGQPLHTVLRLRVDSPGTTSQDLARLLAARLGRPVTADWARKRLYLARRAFTDVLLDEVARSLDDPTADAIEDELSELGLLDHYVMKPRPLAV